MKKRIESPRELRNICQKSLQGFGPNVALQKILIQKVSIYITWAFLHTPITANQITVLLIIIGLLGSLLLAFDNQWIAIMGVVLLFSHTMLDYVDGEVARYKAITSPSGKYLDIEAHKVVSPMIFAGLSFGAYHNINHPVVFMFGFLAAISISLMLDVRATVLRSLDRAELNYDKLDAKGENTSSSSFKKMRGLGLHSLLFGILIIEAAILIGAIFNRLDIVLIFYGVVMPIYAFSRLYWWFKVIKSFERK